MTDNSFTQREMEVTLLGLWARLEGAVKAVGAYEAGQLTERQLHLRLITVLQGTSAENPSMEEQGPTFVERLHHPLLSEADLVIRWRNLYSDEIGVVRKARNIIAHAGSIAAPDIRSSINIGARVLAYLHIGLGDARLEVDPLLLRAFKIAGTNPPVVSVP